MKTFKIVKIVDNMSVIINGGAIHGIKINDIFRIYTQSDVVIDPETNEELGSFETTKATLKAFNVFEKMTICKNALYDSLSQEAVNISLINVSLFNIYGNHKPLNVDKKQITPLIHDNTIRVGDVVVPVDFTREIEDDQGNEE